MSSTKKTTPWLWENFDTVWEIHPRLGVQLAKRCRRCGATMSKNPAGCNSHLQKHVRESRSKKGPAMSEARRLRAEQAAHEIAVSFGGVITSDDQCELADALLQFAAADVRAAVAEFVAKVNTRAEADMLAGNPIAGAHHRALIVELAAVQPASGAREGTG